MRSTRFRLHVGIEGGREVGGGERGRGRESGCKSVVGRVGRVSAGAIAFPWKQAREHVSSHLQNTFYSSNTLLTNSLMYRYPPFRRPQGAVSSSPEGRSSWSHNQVLSG
jgi:hypothetical protein